MDKRKKTAVRFFVNYHKELKWLEEMALKGWFLSNLTFGCIYHFAKGEPKRLVYDMDRFNLSKKPSLEEIRRKEMFMEMAQEMGWREITHSEDMTYYFVKEYEEGGINYLHNDQESRQYRSANFKSFFSFQAKRNVFWVTVVMAVDFLVRLMSQVMPERQGFSEWYDWFVLVYAIIGNSMAVWYWRRGVRYEAELAMTREEWEQSIDHSTHKTVRKLLLTNRGLNRFLSRQAEEGWTLTGLTPTRYFFEKSIEANQIYTMDSKWLVNKRREHSGGKRIGDSKDWNGMNNDWEIQSVHDAQERGWTFVCALENRGIIYRGDAERVKPLNDEKYDRKIRWISLIGEYGFYLLVGGFIGGIVGIIMGFFGL